MKALIIEDEEKSRRHLETLIHQLNSNIELCGNASCIKEARELFYRFKPELLFLDIELGSDSAFDLLVQLEQQNFSVIFTTAHDQYGIPAIKFSAIDYLLKPIQPKELNIAIEKAIAQRNLKGYAQQIQHLLTQLSQKTQTNRTIAIPQSRELRFIQVSDIMQLVASNNYTHLLLKDGEKLTASKGIFHFEELLRPAGFIRTHQSHLANPDYIKSIRPKGSICDLQLTDGSIVPVSKRNMATVRQILSSLQNGRDQAIQS